VTARTAADIQDRLDDLTRQRDALTDTSSPDPAVARLSGAGLHQQRSRSDAHMRRWKDLNDRIAGERHHLALAKAREESAAAKAAPLTADDLKGAETIRTRHGLDQVVKVNKTTVTVDDGWGPRRVPFNMILGVVKAT
jgi:hypothetical protein